MDVIVGELALLDRQRQSNAPHMVLLTPPRRVRADRRLETLALFLDLGGGGADGLARALVENFERAYWRRSGPVTSALREAINAANDHLREENRLLPISHRRRAGLACAVLREDRAYLAQAGPAKAFLLNGGQVTRFPKIVRDPLPLGVSSGLNIQFSYASMRPGDIVLLTGDSWTTEMSDDALAKPLAIPDAGIEDVMLAVERQVGRQPFSALIVQCGAAVPAPETTAPQIPVVLDKSLEFEPGSAVMASQLARETDFEARALPGDATASAARIESRDARGGTRRFWPLPRPRLSLSFSPDLLEGARERLRQFGLVLADAVRAFLMRVLPEPASTPPLPRRRGRRAPENVLVMASVAIAIPLLVAFVVASFYLQRSATERREALVNRALTVLEEARQASEEDAHSQWETALAAANEALQVASDDERIVTAQAEARAKLDELDQVRRPELITLWRYAPGEHRRLAASRMQVFVLDPDQDQVTQHTLDQTRQRGADDELTLVAYRGESVGEHTVGELHDIVWLDGGGGRGGDVLLVLTADGGLLQHSLSWGLSWVPLETALFPDNVRAIDAYEGRLYVLDVEEKTIWRLPPAGSGFGQAEKYFEVPRADLGNAIDMTIDGAISVLLADGRIARFFGGESQAFQFQGLPQPLVRPVAVVSEGDSEQGALYLADAGAECILVLDKEGRFLYQIRAEQGLLADLEDVAIEKASRTLYVLASDTLYAMALPPVPVTPEGGEQP